MADYWGDPSAWPFWEWGTFKAVRVARLTTPFVVFGYTYPWLIQWRGATGGGGLIGASLVSDTPCISTYTSAPVPLLGPFPYGLAVDPDH